MQTKKKKKLSWAFQEILAKARAKNTMLFYVDQNILS